MTIGENEKKYFLKIAREAIGAELGIDDGVEIPEETRSSPLFQQKSGCFVTLHKSGALRGCIGTLDAENPLLEGVSSNARFAAFMDSRFPSLTREEFNEIDIEISILSEPETLYYSGAEDLKEKLIPGKHGVILSYGRKSATFLPQVWEQLPDPERFLSHLCQKAGLSSNFWKGGELSIKTYTVEKFGENQL